MSDKESTSDRFRDRESPLHLQFCPWLIAQISSGEYPGLEWINEEEKRVFKIPWTKVNYPMWEEHHQIFKAWAIHRGKPIADTGEMEQSFSQIKSNFRTILRKCVEIEEVYDAHQLGLQTGNYKVYRILSEEESSVKRKAQQKIRKAYKSSRGDCRSSHGTNTANQKFIVGNPIVKLTRIQASSRKMPDVFTAVEPKMAENTRTQSTQTSTEDFPKPNVQFLLEPAAFEEAVGPETKAVMATDDISSSLHDCVNTQFEICTQVEPMDFALENALNENEEKLEPTNNEIVKEVSMDVDQEKTVSGPLDGFQLLLEAAQLADAPSKVSRSKVALISRDVQTTATQPIPPSIVDVLVELKIPPEELFTYEMHVRYETRHVMSDVVLNDMSYGYRIHYGNHKDQRELIQCYEPGKPDLVADFDCTPITLPESKVPPGNSLYTVLKNLDAGFIVKSDNSYTLRAKRLCMSRMYAFTKYGDVNADTDALLMPRDREIVLFSYKTFLQEWHQFLIEGSPRPNHEINLAFGKKPKHRHSRVFVSVRLVPKAAETMLQKISYIDNKSSSCDAQESTLDNILRLFNNDFV